MGGGEKREDIYTIKVCPRVFITVLYQGLSKSKRKMDEIVDTTLLSMLNSFLNIPLKTKGT